jgi:23S rRNA-/tRNA-specific pseudouridylate synthase
MKGREFDDGKEVNLYYEMVASNHTYSLLKIRIDLGKFHQIRAQLSLAGFPILGDVKYGGPHWHDEKAIALCATEISFKKATEDEVVHLTIDTPKDWKQYL